MDAAAYDAFTDDLLARVSADDRVVGLVALGSMAQRDYAPDRWSDHDFYLVVEDGHAETFRRDLWWLPPREGIALPLRETAHGLKVLYADGHLLEFAVFDRAELQVAKAGRSRVLLDRGSIAAAIEAISGEVLPDPSSVDVDWNVAVMATNVLVGIGRWARGERLSAHVFVTGHALGHLLTALVTARGVDVAVLDGLDQRRRFERAHPVLGSELDTLLERPLPETASGLLTVARRELGERLSPATHAALDITATIIAAAVRELQAGKPAT